MDEVDPSSGESLPRAFETNFFLETGRLVSNTVSQFLSLLFHVHLFSRGYFLPFFSSFLLLDFFKRYIISFFLRSFFYVLLFHVLLSIIFVSLRVALRETMFSFFFFCALIMKLMEFLRWRRTTRVIPIFFIFHFFLEA